MHVAVDVDGTVDAAPRQLQSLMSSLKATGRTVSILTGSEATPVTAEDWQEKADYLNSLGCGQCWDHLVVIADTNDLATAKAAWCSTNGVDVLIDNSKDNAKATVAAGIPLVLVPWASRA